MDNAGEHLTTIPKGSPSPAGRGTVNARVRRRRGGAGAWLAQYLQWWRGFPRNATVTIGLGIAIGLLCGRAAWHIDLPDVIPGRPTAWTYETAWAALACQSTSSTGSTSSMADRVNGLYGYLREVGRTRFEPYVAHSQLRPTPDGRDVLSMVIALRVVGTAANPCDIGGLTLVWVYDPQAARWVPDGPTWGYLYDRPDSETVHRWMIKAEEWQERYHAATDAEPTPP